MRSPSIPRDLNFLHRSEHQPHCVVLDLHMPVLNGFEVQEALTGSAYEIRVIVVTADATPENVARAMNLGAAACLKPVDDARLLDAVAFHCGNKSNRVALKPEGERVTDPA